MARISKERKQEIRKSILANAAKNFYEKGFEKTSTKELAKAVGIAEGTLFNYFDSKSDIFLETVSHEFQKNEVFIGSVDLVGAAADVLTDFIEHLYTPFLKLPKFLMIEMITVLTKIGKKDFAKLKKLAELDFKYMDETRILVDKMKNKGFFVDELDSKLMAETLYGALFLELTLYAYYQDMTREDLRENIRSKVAFISKGYIKTK